MGLRALKYFNSFSAGTVFIRQNLTSADSNVQRRSPRWKGSCQPGYRLRFRFYLEPKGGEITTFYGVEIWAAIALYSGSHTIIYR